MPEEPSEVSEKSLNHTIAFVLAPHVNSAEHLFEAAQHTCQVGVAALFILAHSSVVNEATEAMRVLNRKGRGPLVQAAEIDFAAFYNNAEELPCLHEEPLSEGFLSALHDIAESLLDTYEQVVIIDASCDAPSVDELRALYANPGDLSSWVSQGRFCCNR